MKRLVRTWGWLVLLAAATTLVALLDIAAPYAGILILFAAWAKASLIFLWYLGLAPVHGWRQGVQFGLAFFVLLLFVLYIAAFSLSG